MGAISCWKDLSINYAGTCSSAAMLEDFFPDCLRIVNEMIEEIRALPDEVRH